MAPTKFGLFKARSRDQAEQPSTENLLQNSASMDTLATPGSPAPSTSRVEADRLAQMIEMDAMSIQSDENDKPSNKVTHTRRPSNTSKDESQVHYKQLENQQSTDATSMSTLCDVDAPDAVEVDDDASTSCDANSLQLDVTSISGSEISVHCGGRRMKRRLKEERQMSDCDMWQASNVEVMQNLLSRSGTLDEQIKWEAIATSRGLCTLTDNCSCNDCYKAKYLAGVTDGDGGLGAAPLFNAISVGCVLQ